MDVPVTIPELIASFAEYGDRVWFATPEEELTYAESDTRSAELARSTPRRGQWGRARRVAMVLANSNDWVIVVARARPHRRARNPSEPVRPCTRARVRAASFRRRGRYHRHLVRRCRCRARWSPPRCPDSPTITQARRHFSPAIPICARSGGWATAGPRGRPTSRQPHRRRRSSSPRSKPRCTRAIRTSRRTRRAPPLRRRRSCTHRERSCARRTRCTSVVISRVKTVSTRRCRCSGSVASASCCSRRQPTERSLPPTRNSTPGALSTSSRSTASPACTAGRKRRRRWSRTRRSPTATSTSVTAGPTALRGAQWDHIALDQREQSLGMTETCGPHTYSMDTDAILPDHLRGSFGPPMENMEHKIVDRDTARGGP